MTHAFWLRRGQDRSGSALNGGWRPTFLVLLAPPLALVCSACSGGVGSGSKIANCLQKAGTNANQVSQCAKSYGVSGRASCAGYSAAAIGSASFEIDGRTYVSVAIAGACPNAFSISGHPELNYSGVPGCQGRYFYDDANYIRFRYSSSDAYMLWNDTVYHFVSGPGQSGGALVFDQSFPQHHIVVRLGCPPPPLSGPLLPPSY